MTFNDMDNSGLLIKAAEVDVEMYITWLEKIETSILDKMILAGGFKSSEYPVWPRNHDNFHYPLGMRFLLSHGFSGIKRIALQNAEKTNGNKKKYLLLIHRVYEAVIICINRFANEAKRYDQHLKVNICEKLTLHRPNSFFEACQLYWFATLFRIGTSTIGRIDQHLFPFYINDIENGILSKKEARTLIAELLYRYEQRGNRTGDTLQNITLSGRNSSGDDETNDLTYMILEEYNKTNYIEPKINIRVHENTPVELKTIIAKMQMNGSGNCTIFNDESIISGLKNYGRPDKVASDYCADGCSEIILDGYGETAFRYIDCIKAVEHTLFNGESRVSKEKKLQYYDQKKESVDVKPPVRIGKKTGDFASMGRFEDFLLSYYDQLKYQVEKTLEKPYNQDENPIRIFTAATFPSVLETGLDPFINQDCYHTYGLFIGSLGTAVNSLMAVKTMIYDKVVISHAKLLDALDADFEGYEQLKEQCLNVPKFGNDNTEVDALAIEVSEAFSEMVKEFHDRLGRPVLPGLYNHLFHHTAYNTGATPDGRKYGDPVGEHLSPTPGTALKGPSAVINSVTKINTSKQIFGSTLHLNIPKLSLNGHDNGINNLRALNDVFCVKNGCVMNVNILDAKILFEAQQHPEMYKDLVVRVWGFSYYFCLLSKEMQDHVISRAQDI